MLSHAPDGIVPFNARFLDLANHYGFTPRACKPYRARTKGKDERMVGYLKQHFFVRYRAFESWAHLNQQLADWLMREADQRRHGTLKQVVADQFAQEQPSLQPLPAQPYDTSYRETRQVGWDCSIDIHGNRYSVPATLAGQVVVVWIGLDGQLRVYHDDLLLVTHQLRPAAEGWVQVPEHHAALWQQVLKVEQRSLAVVQGGGAMELTALLERLRLEHLEPQLDAVDVQRTCAPMNGGHSTSVICGHVPPFLTRTGLGSGTGAGDGVSGAFWNAEPRLASAREGV